MWLVYFNHGTVEAFEAETNITTDMTAVLDDYLI